MKIHFRYAAGLIIHFAVAALAVFTLSGCSVVECFQQLHGARSSLGQAREARTCADYNGALQSYREAERQFLTARESQLYFIRVDERLAKLQKELEEMQKDAEEGGYTRVGNRYLRGEELSTALTNGFKELLGESYVAAVPQDRIVVDNIEVSAKRTWNDKIDIVLTVVVKEAGGEEQFPQDVWSIVRFFLEGAFGYGFSYHLGPRYEQRAWLGAEGQWGESDRMDAANRLVCLKDSINELSMDIYRGAYRQEADPTYHPYGFENLSALGPYWKKTFYKEYTIKSADAARLNWDKPRRIPDETIYGMLHITDTPPENDGHDTLKKEEQ
jgi:hypothetical protein